MWNSGKRPIPPECARLIRMYERRELGVGKNWKDFKMVGEQLILPTNQAVTPQQILIAVGVLEISAPNDYSYVKNILRYARVLASYEAKNRPS
ncbi:hypothetical protein VMF7928_02466 [Vibrio marisflavi CECT 7928]|uniref:Uncharacterized protein n=2 Tax=Vibrio marisflavi TaxID=1216040 RepID=A0ABN8E3I3_9VIBR|nr:hypothetical protein VMF7928_02466 [Vibrio marisflavi CECT 7928]